MNLGIVLTAVSIGTSQRRDDLDVGPREDNSGDDERHDNNYVSNEYLRAKNLINPDDLVSQREGGFPVYIVEAANAQGVSTDTVMAMLREDHILNQAGCYNLESSVCRSCPYQGLGSESIVLTHFRMPAGPCGKEPSN